MHAGRHLPTPLLLACLLVPGLVPAQDPPSPDPRVRPGATFTVPYPDHPMPLCDRPSVMSVAIPSDYNPERRHPLLLWLNVGQGPPDPSDPVAITGGKRFVCVSLPLFRTPAGRAKPGIEGIHLEPSDVPLMWPLHRQMLDDLERLVPNLHPSHRIVGGGSNGAHAIGLFLNGTQGEFQRRFGAYLFWEGGYTLQDLASIRGRPALFCWGERNLKERLGALASQATAAGVDVETIEMPGLGHEFPATYHPRFLDWMERKVLYRGLPEAVAALDAAVARSRWQEVPALVRTVRDACDPSRPEWARADEAAARIEREGAEALARMRSGEPSLEEWRAFVRAWPGCACVQDARPLCEPLVERELDRALALAGRPRIEALRTFVSDWEGFRCHARALVEYDSAAHDALAPVLATPPAMRARALRRFLDEWRTAPCSSEAIEALESLARAELAEIRAIRAAERRRPRLEAFARAFEGTAAAREAAAEAAAIPPR